MNDSKVGGPRRDYDRGALREEDAGDDPFRLFALWMNEALAAGFHEPNAMALATATPDGHPSVRMVLLKELDARGFVFYSNFESRKGRELAGNPFASAVLWWDRLERQVRIEGTVARVDDAQADAYFATRPQGARLAAWASPQSRPLADRADLAQSLAELSARFTGTEIPRPPFWGGWRIEPDAIEFWQGRPDRLHDRLIFRRSEGGRWTRERLAP